MTHQPKEQYKSMKQQQQTWHFMALILRQSR